LDWRDKSGVFDGVAIHTGVPLNLRQATGGDLVWGELVSDNYFAVLEMQPALGHFFTAQGGTDAAPGTDPFVVLSYDAWRSRFNGDAGVVGTSVRINGKPFTIVGVAPRGFKGMRKFGFWPEMWVPMGMRAAIDSSISIHGRGTGQF